MCVHYRLDGLTNMWLKVLTTVNCSIQFEQKATQPAPLASRADTFYMTGIILAECYLLHETA